MKTWKLPPPSAMISIPQVVEKMEPLDSAQLWLVLSRGIAEAVHRTNAWVFTSGYADDVGAELAGEAMLHGHNQLTDFRGSLCLGMPAQDCLAENEHLSYALNGM